MSDLVRLMVGPEQSDNVRFGLLIQSLRDEAGFSRAQAASATGLSSEFVRLIERGVRVPAAGTARVILEEYGVPFQTERSADCAVIIFRGHRVEFTSRVQKAAWRKPTSQSNRNETIGRIISLLTIADDQTLYDIHQKLRG